VSDETAESPGFRRGLFVKGIATIEVAPPRDTSPERKRRDLIQALSGSDGI
jgi:hypothetical protein